VSKISSPDVSKYPCPSCKGTKPAFCYKCWPCYHREHCDPEQQQTEDCPHCKGEALPRNHSPMPSSTTKPDYAQIGSDIGKLVTEKQAAYGDSFSKAGQILRVYFPNGIKPEQYDSVLTFARVIDKMFRAATDEKAFGESPWKDIAGYALLEVGKAAP
jgi:hypothetical protein